MRLRVLPIMIVAFAVVLTFKLNDLWHDMDLLAVAKSADVGEALAGRLPKQARGPRDDLPGSETDLSAELERLGAISPAAGETEDTEADARPDPSDEAGLDESEPDAAEQETAATDSLQVEDPFDLSDEEIELLQQLTKRREEIDRRAREIDQRTALLEAAESRIEEKLGQLETLKATIEGLMIQHDEQEEAQLRSLVKIYENMKPKEAARIFEQLDMVVLLEVIDRMRERRVAPVLANMSPAKAKAITIELAQRRQLPIAKN